jgi:arylsulfatase B
MILLLACGCGSLGIAPPADSSDTSADSRTPNLVVVLLDDFGLDMASFDASSPCYDVADVENDAYMPNIAALCESGLRFERAWASPTCSPTRAAILTGRHPYQTGVYAPVSAGHVLDLDTPTLPALLPRYTAANIGKWHVSLGADDPRRAGWGHFAGLIAGALPSYTGWDRTEDGTTAFETGYATTVNVDDALAWLDTVGDEPFLLWLGFNAPHAPYHVPPGSDLEPYVEGAAHPWAAAMSEVLDAELGRLISEIVAQHRWEETVIVVMGDNGSTENTADSPFRPGRVKGSLYEGGLRVPLIVAGPGVTAGSTDALVSAVDLFPTLLELAGVAAPESDGISFASCLATGDCAGSGASLAQIDHDVTGTALRDDTHKLICFPDHAELYDLAQDPFESTDLGTTSAFYPALRDRLEGWIGAEVCP